MLLPQVLVAILVPVTAAGTRSFGLTSTMPDGVYKGGLDATTGLVVWTRLGAGNSTDASSSRLGLEVLDDVPGQEIHCTGSPLDALQYETGAALIRNYCITGGMIDPKGVVLFVQGTAGWYVCDWAAHAQACTTNDLANAETSIRNACRRDGRYLSGYDHLAGNDMTYGVAAPGEALCPGIFG